MSIKLFVEEKDLTKLIYNLFRYTAENNEELKREAKKIHMSPMLYHANFIAFCLWEFSVCVDTVEEYMGYVYSGIKGKFNNYED